MDCKDTKNTGNSFLLLRSLQSSQGDRFQYLDESLKTVLGGRRDENRKKGTEWLRVKSPISFYSLNVIFVPAPGPRYCFFTCLSPREDRQPPEGDPGSAHLSHFLISGPGAQQARALFGFLTRGAPARALGRKWGRERHARCPPPALVGSPRGPLGKAGVPRDTGGGEAQARPTAIGG